MNPFHQTETLQKETRYLWTTLDIRDRRQNLALFLTHLGEYYFNVYENLVLSRRESVIILAECFKLKVTKAIEIYNFSEREPT